MRVLVLDTIHGGTEIAEALEGAGHTVDAVDVYRGEVGISVAEAARRSYDLIVAPVHLDPDHPLLRRGPEVITHHEAVRLLLLSSRPGLMVEVTGARGKTTTATALAHVLGGRGVLHTSMGTFVFPERRRLWRRSITPASVLPAAREAVKCGGWLIAEESLGVSGAGDLAVLTSGDDYPCAAGKRRAITEKVRSLAAAARVLVPAGVTVPGAVGADEVAVVEGTHCIYRYGEVQGSFENPLLALRGYRTPLQMAAVAACLLGRDPTGLADFAPLTGRMAVSREHGRLTVDCANSGACREIAADAAAYARALGGGAPFVLVIGTEGQTICEGFPADEVVAAVQEIGPDKTVIVGDYDADDLPAGAVTAADLEDGISRAEQMSNGGTIVLAVKTWR
ncbi:coenzyme F430 synthase [Methanofollis aquaemaris]|uniref:Coenzyme F430 synthase n=1 Tax=Methanofollis aquaemaris TaxID=126734 RepID=A0A8A3S354_9EURY|nr:coenzyme F430 synthase [Methanofollis aquaemaris]QSZ66697.1 coenzyme F430 synthase [Methanofollis aquaemaris]